MMPYALIGIYRTETILPSVESGQCIVPVLAAPQGTPLPEQDWVTAYYLELPIALQAGDELHIDAQTQVRVDTTYNVQVVTDIGLTDGWEGSNIDDAQYRPGLPIGSDLSQNPIHYAAITRTTGYWRCPGPVKNPCVQFRCSSASTAADGNGTCEVLNEHGFLSVAVYRPQKPKPAVA